MSPGEVLREPPPAQPPSDPALPSLARALDAAEMEPRLAALLADGSAHAPRVALLSARLVRHKPGRRALVAYSLRVDPPGELRHWLGKCRARGTDRRTFRAVRELRAAGLDGRDGVEIPRAVGLLPELGMWLQERVPGETAWSGLAAPGGAALARRIADALHRLHQAVSPPARGHGVADELRILDERLRSVARLQPAWTGRLERLLEACRRSAAAIPASAPRGIHRDFYPDQVLVGPDRIHLVDLDLFCAGDPALDAGNFLAHLSEWALRQHGNPQALADREAAFAERFLELAGGGRAAAVRAWTDLALARHVEISTRIAERRPFSEALLELCEQRLARAHST